MGSSLFPARPETVKKLARALYETDSGSNGYPPLHESITWADLAWWDTYLDRAREILRKMEAHRG